MTVERFSISFTLGKASTEHGANVAHNNRKFLADNINPAETAHNISYKMQSVESAYQELFGEAVAEYNAAQKRPCRRIADYYSHIANEHREDPFYEAVVQFGDCRTVQPGTQRWYAAQTMLNDYMRDFEKRNPNLFVFNAVMHLDEARAYLDEVKAAQKDAAEKLEMIEKIMNGTYMQDMLDKFSERKRSEIVPNGYYNANTGVRRR